MIRRPTFDLQPYADLYPWAPSYHPIAGHQLHCLDVGEGEPVVMLHGNPTWSFYWRHLVRGLQGSYRCIVPDHMGCGLSDKPDDSEYDYTLRQRVDDLDELLDQLGVTGGVTLILHDWGGMIGLAWAQRHPERLKRLVLLNTGGFGLPSGKRLPLRIGVVRYLPFFDLPTRRLNLFALGAAWFCSTVPGRMSDHVKAAYLAPYDSYEHRIAVQRFVEDIPLKPGDRAWDIVQAVDRWLPSITDVPVQICWGVRDFVFDDHFLAGFRERIPHARIHEYIQAGHYVLEDAHEQIVPTVRSFLAAHPVD